MEKEKLKELLNRPSKRDMILRNYSNDIERYLTAKLPKMPSATAQEISEYITNKTANMTLDLMAENARIQNARMERYHHN